MYIRYYIHTDIENLGTAFFHLRIMHKSLHVTETAQALHECILSVPCGEQLMALQPQRLYLLVQL